MILLWIVLRRSFLVWHACYLWSGRVVCSTLTYGQVVGLLNSGQSFDAQQDPAPVQMPEEAGGAKVCACVCVCLRSGVLRGWLLGWVAAWVGRRVLSFGVVVLSVCACAALKDVLFETMALGRRGGSSGGGMMGRLCVRWGERCI